MTQRTLTYIKNGFDIKAIVSGKGENAVANVMYKPYGAEDYINIGQIYQILTGACGTTRDTLTWNHVEVATVLNKKSWHEAAKDLYTAYRKNKK